MRRLAAVLVLAAEMKERFVDSGGDPANPAFAALLQSFRVERVLKGPVDLMAPSDVTLVLSDVDLANNVDTRDTERIAPSISPAMERLRRRINTTGDRGQGAKRPAATLQ
jgi:hypothetical protein